jgi:hypothetical protein
VTDAERDADRDAALLRAAEVLGLLAEPDRLRVVAALVLGASSAAEVAERTGLPVKATMRALTRLEAGGLVESSKDGWTLAADQLKDVARAAAPPEDAGDFGTADREAAAVLRAFVRDGRLTSIPAHRGKRLVVLDHVVRVFEPGIRYPEREVNSVLRAFHDDVAALRRYLVDEGLMSREGGEYWRTGGTVDL